MKKKIIILIFIVAFALIALICWYTYPKKYSLNIEGISYQLGSTNQQFAKSLSIEMDGKISRHLNGTKDFRGTINLENESIPVSEKAKELHITFNKDGDGSMIYSDIKDGSPKMYAYGIIFINEDFSKVSIMKYKAVNDNVNNESKSWDAKDGLMISGPAMDREQAIKISNELMSNYLKGYILK